MWEVLLDALIDSLKMLPILLTAYILIEIVEEYLAKKRERKSWSPLLGASFGLIPQCGFSVIATDLYSKKQITIGALLAVYIATSDEAIPVMLSHPDKILSLLPLLAIKFVFAIVVGFSANAIFKKKSQQTIITSEDKELSTDHHIGCCGHHVDHCEKKWKKFLLHPLLHSLKIFVYILIINVVFGIIVYAVGEQTLINFLSLNYYFSPLFAVLIGMIPNCVSSVIITQMFIMGGLPFGACLAGLCINAGLALIILFKQNKNLKQNFAILGSLFGLSLALGYVILFVQPLLGF